MTRLILSTTLRRRAYSRPDSSGWSPRASSHLPDRDPGIGLEVSLTKGQEA